MINFIKALAGFAALAFAGTAFADPIILSPDNCDTTAGGNCVTSNQVNQPSTEQFNTWLGEEGLEELYKDNFDGAEEGSFADDYSTNFFNTESDPSNATITWDGPDLIGCGVCYAWVKDGNSTPNIYIFDISNWNGKDDIAFQNFFGKKAISNVGILGKAGDTDIPEPGTLGLLGLGLIGLGFARRRRQSA